MSVEVRVRHVDDTANLFLAEVPFDEIDNVIPIVKRWGGFTTPGVEVEEVEMFGHFVYDPDHSPGTVYFEVVIGDS